MIGPEYLGHGVYATEMAGGGIMLTTGDQDESLADDVILMRPGVLDRLDRYRAKMREAANRTVRMKRPR